MKKTYYIKTFGCQMNEHDTQRMQVMLESQGYTPADSPEAAQVVVLNTCSVRANPENKVYSFLGELRPLKQRRPDLIIAVAGCVAQQEGRKIQERMPFVDLVFGPDHLFRLPDLLQGVSDGNRPCETGRQTWEGPVQNFVPESWVDRGHVDGIKAYVAITRGCDNHCAFCVVPRTRGREVSRPSAGIMREARSLLERGARELWLLGQNVNSYRAAGDYGFYELLDEISQLDGLARVRFTSPHPRDWTHALTDLMASRKTICRHLHLPLQSGSDRILGAMRRRHDAASYLEKVDYLRSRMPDVAISTDLIVGFPGEEESDFEQTLEVARRVRFSQVFPFKYSARPGTPAAAWADDVPRQVKEERLARLIALQDRINEEQQRSLTGTIQDVLVEGPHPRESGWFNGRTNGYRAITLCGPGLCAGVLCRVRVTGYRGHWLTGESLL